MTVGDIQSVAAIAAEEPTAPHWPVFEYHRMLEVIALAPGSRGAWVLVTSARDEAGHSPAGFAMARQVAGICDLEAVVVASAWRGQRLGERLLHAVGVWGREQGATRLELEVRASNDAALHLYRRLGFTQDSVRPGYYQNPHEDALLMSLAL